MGSDPKEMKYRRRIRVPPSDGDGQCSGARGMDWGRVASIERLKQDPVELLRELDELRDQITRSCEIIGQPRERRHVSRRALSLLPEHPAPDVAAPLPQLGRGPEYYHSRCAPRYGAGLPPSPYDPLRARNFGCGYEERYMRQPSGHYRHCPVRQWENCGSHQGNCGHGNYHQSACSCVHCHGQHVVREENIPMARYFAGQHECYRFERSSSISSDYDRRSVASSLYSHRSQSKKRTEYFRKRVEHLCRPVRGAAPFIICSSCSQLLQMPPEKCMARKQNRLQCGSCSEMIDFKLEEVKISPYIPSSSIIPLSKIEQGSNDQVSQDFEYRRWDDNNSTCYKSEKCDSPQQNVDFADDNSLSSTVSHERTGKEWGSNMIPQSKVEGLSLSPSRSGDVTSPKDILCQRDVDPSVEHTADGQAGAEAPVLEDKLIDPFSSPEKDKCVEDQGRSKKYKQKSKEDDNNGVEDGCSSKKYEWKSKKDENVGAEYGSISKKYEQQSKEDDNDGVEDGSISKKCEQKSKEDGNDGLGDESMSGRYEQKSKTDNKVALEDDGISNRFEQKNKETDNSKLQQPSIEDTPALANTGSSVNGRTNSGFSRGSSEGGQDEDQSSTGKSSDSSFFAGFLKKGFKDLSLFNQSMDNAKVSINGHPISDRALKKAEKKAGPVDPGAYWYDYRAGFWGVMGRECVGIVPPFIREFNYPMPRNCAGGNTGVLVNGRELHQRDLELLVRRGLPSISGKSYSIEISGNVTDETSGQKLRSLGKLAPTIEKLKRGFGMHVPEEIS